MKRASIKIEKNFWEEFCEYLASIYQPQAEDYLPKKLLKWEYKRFLELISR